MTTREKPHYFLSRRQMLSAGAATLGSMPAALRRARAAGAIEAIAFDGFVIFDPRPIFALAERLFPLRGKELVALWRARQFEYTWLRTLSRTYADFWTVTEEALVYAARAAKVELGAAERRQLMETYLVLKAHPDVLPGLRSLRAAGIRLAYLSNMTERMLAAATRSAGLEGFFEFALSTDRVRAYKPDPRAYQMGVDAFALPRERIAFAAFGGWDAAGAKAFGYPTFWCNRLGLPVEVLGFEPDAIGATVSDLANFAARP